RPLPDAISHHPPLPAKSKPDAEVTVNTAEIGEEGLAASELKYPSWRLPPVSLLNPFRKAKASDTDKERNAKIIEKTLLSFNVDAQVVDAYVGPSVVQYALSIPMGVPVSKISRLAENLALALGVDSNAVRIETIPGTTYLGVEVPRGNRDEVKIRELMESDEMRSSKYYLPGPVGKDISGEAIVVDIQKMPHLLIAGATGSGKSIFTNTFIVSLLMNRTPDELRLILVDPKQVELSDYNGIPHLLTPVITDMDKVVNALKWLVTEMERRYNTLSKAQVRNIEGYNQKMGFAAMPYIVIVIDEMADMMMTANRVEAETAIVRLAQKARAVGIHLVLATQRPSVNVITGLIKANIPARVGMSVTSGTDSRVILDSVGAESLMGRGDLLYKAPDKPKSMRLQGSFVSQEEVVRVVDFIKSQVPEVEYAMSILEPPVGPGGEVPNGENLSDDDLFINAIKVVVNYQKGSSSFLQRKLNIGFNRAARLLEEMEENGIVGPSQGSKPREVLITDAEEFINSLRNQPAE
ncbi:DNA translocase FtsK, partial [Candidatus Dojkabacteria bacterium]|nr:DNA translocase FtsK [Candidatus Dojkabacteria bacterium]